MFSPGASTGIGFELAHIAADHGYDPLIVADLSTIDGVDTLLAAAEGRRIDLLFANAGRGLGHGFLDQDVADWRRVIDTKHHRHALPAPARADGHGRAQRRQGAGDGIDRRLHAGQLPGGL